MNPVARVASTSAVAALVLAAVWLFWPATLGGAATYVTTHGVSMEPAVSTGDLAVLRPADAYAVGDVVAYRSATLDTVVMHRIVSGDAAGFVTRGDNNDWLDEDRPTQDEILGSLLVRVPRGGTALQGLRSPVVLAVLAVAGTVITAVVRRPPRRDRTGPAARRGARRPSRSFPAPVRARARQTALGAAVVALLAGGACAVLAALPATQERTSTVTVVQQGRYDYTATAVPGTTYPTGAVTTGDPIWTRLVRDLTVSYTSTLAGPGLSEVRATVRLEVSVTASDGWRATLASSPAVPVVDGTATAAVAVDPQAAAELLEAHFAEIGEGGGQATLEVSPVVEGTGSVAGQPFALGPPAALPFALDATSLRLADAQPAALAPAAQIPVAVEEVVPRTVPLLGWSLPVPVARVVAAAVLGLALAVAALAAWVGGSSRTGPADQFLVRHADRIVPVLSVPPAAAVIDVDDASSLHRIAERFDTVVLHHASAEGHVFAVRDADATYRLVLPPGARHRSGKPPVPAAPSTAAAATPAPPSGPDAPDATIRLPRARAAPPGAVPGGGGDATSPLQRVA